MTAASFVLFVVIAILVKTGATAAADTALAAGIQSLANPLLTKIMIVISFLGEWYIYLPFVVLILCIPVTRFSAGIPLIFDLGAAAALNFLLKRALAIPRPDVRRFITETGYGFPSAHAMIGAAFIGLAVPLTWHYAKSRALKGFFLAAGLCFLLLVGFSRVYLGVHHPSDILGGYLAGLFVGAGIQWILRCSFLPSRVALAVLHGPGKDR